MGYVRLNQFIFRKQFADTKKLLNFGSSDVYIFYNIWYCFTPYSESRHRLRLIYLSISKVHAINEDAGRFPIRNIHKVFVIYSMKDLYYFISSSPLLFGSCAKDFPRHLTCRQPRLRGTDECMNKIDHRSTGLRRSGDKHIVGAKSVFT